MIAGWVRSAVNRALGKVPNMDNTLRPFLANMVRWVILAFVIVAVLNQFGVETTSMIAVLGAAGLAIGLALQGTLSNVASGVMLLLMRPFKIGDFIAAGSLSGTVMEIGLFTSELKTGDGIYIMAPNSQIWNQNIINFARNPTRRIDILVGIAYDDDIDAAHQKYGKKNFDPSDITSGSIHSSFFIRIPSGHKLKITSSHAGKRAV